MTDLSSIPNIKDVLISYTNEREPFISMLEGEAVLGAMLEYGKIIRDQTLEWASNNAKIEYKCTAEYCECYGKCSFRNPVVDKDSILLGKEHADLKIKV